MALVIIDDATVISTVIIAFQNMTDIYTYKQCIARLYCRIRCLTAKTLNNHAYTLRQQIFTRFCVNCSCTTILVTHARYCKVPQEILGFKSGIKLLTDDVWCCVAVPSEVLSSLGSFAGGGEVLGLGDLSSSSSSEELSLKERYCLFHFFMMVHEKCGWEWMEKANEYMDDNTRRGKEGTAYMVPETHHPCGLPILLLNQFRKICDRQNVTRWHYATLPGSTASYCKCTQTCIFENHGNLFAYLLD